FGLNLAGWTLRSPTAVSYGGNVIVGSGINPAGQTEGWIADLTPSLAVSRGAGHVVISWSTNAAEFTLQQTVELNSNAWTNAPAPTVVSDRYVLTNSTVPNEAFFRLIKP